MGHIKRIILCLIDWLTLVIMIPLFISSLFFSRGIDFSTLDEVTKRASVSPFLSVFFALLFCSVIFCITFLFRYKDHNKNLIVSYVLTILMLIVMISISIFWVLNNPFAPTADQEKVWTAATAIAKGTSVSEEYLAYFDVYPSQKVMAMLMAALIHVIGPILLRARVVNAVLILATALGIIICTKEITDDPQAISLLAFLTMSFFPLVLYASFIYGQIGFFALSVWSFYGVIKHYKTNKQCWLVIPALFMPVSIMLYRVGIIFFIAMVIIVFFYSGFSDKIRNKWICRIGLILFVVTMTVLISGIAEREFDKKLGKMENGGEGAPTIALISSAIDEENCPDFPGGSTGERHLYIDNNRDTAKTAEYAKEQAEGIIKEYVEGKRSLLFFAHKSEHQWLDPWFGGLTMTVYSTESGDEAWDDFVNSDIMPTLEKYLHILMVFLYFGVIFCQIFRIAERNTSIPAYFPNVFFLGGFIFSLFWEQKSRYCLPYYLALFPLAAYGIVRLFRWIGDRGAYNRITGNNMSTLKRVYIVITIGLFFVISGQYIKDKEFVFIPQMDYSDSRDTYYSDYLALNAGDYGITLEYAAKKDTEISMYLDDSDTCYPAVMGSDQNEFFYELHLDEYNDRIRFEYNVNEPDDFILKGIRIESAKALYTDHIFLALSFLLIAIYFYLLLTSKRFINLSKKEKLMIAGVHVSIIFVSLPLFSHTLFWGHDAPAHVMRLEGVKNALLNGQIPVFIFPKNANGYGLLGYLYPNFFLYIPAVCRILGTSIPFIMNMFYVFINVLTAIIAYIGAGAFYERREARYVFSVLYVLLPYRLVNIYTRADIGETMAMCFIPLILAGLYVCVSDSAIWNGKQGIAALVMGITGVIHSHVLSSAMLVGMALLYAVIFIKNILRKEKLKIVLWSGVGILLLNIGYIVPFIKMYMFGLNFDVELDRGIVFEGRYSLLELLGVHDFSDKATWGGVSVIGVLGIILFLVGFLNSIRKKEINMFMVVSGLLAILLLVSNGREFPWYMFKDIDAVSAVMRVFEFSFRVMLISAPLLTLVMTYYLYKMEISEKQRNAIVFLLVVTAFICVIPGLTGELKAEPYIGKLGGGASETILREYLPEGVTPGVYDEDRLFWSSENLIIDKYEKDGLKIGFDYTINGEGNEWIAPPILYYPGYKAVAVTSSGEEYPLGVSQGAYYRTQIDLPASLSGSHVKMYFGGIWYFYIAYAISIISTVIFILFIIKTILQEKTNAYG